MYNHLTAQLWPANSKQEHISLSLRHHVLSEFAFPNSGANNQMRRAVGFLMNI